MYFPEIKDQMQQLFIGPRFSKFRVTDRRDVLPRSSTERGSDAIITDSKASSTRKSKLSKEQHELEENASAF